MFAATTKSLTMRPPEQSTVTIEDGEEALVECMADLANPEAQITWVLNERSVHLDSRFSISEPKITR